MDNPVRFYNPPDGPEDPDNCNHATINGVVNQPYTCCSVFDNELRRICGIPTQTEAEWITGADSFYAESGLVFVGTGDRSSIRISAARLALLDDGPEPPDEWEEEA